MIKVDPNKVKIINPSELRSGQRFKIDGKKKVYEAINILDRDFDVRVSYYNSTRKLLYVNIKSKERLIIL